LYSIKYLISLLQRFHPPSWTCNAFRISVAWPKQKPEIKINKEISHTILGVDLRKLPWSLNSIFKRTNCNTTHFRLFLYLNGVIFQAHCVNFEIKKEQLATIIISDYLCIQMVCFVKNYVLIWRKHKQVIPAKIIFETIWNKEFLKKTFSMERQHWIASKISWWAMSLHQKQNCF
jgi:hypothetical protein